ncbi:hypothetical protein VIGAN_02260000, partial [Vigna angularis var. angularis]
SILTRTRRSIRSHRIITFNICISFCFFIVIIQAKTFILIIITMCILISRRPNIHGPSRFIAVTFLFTSHPQMGWLHPYKPQKKRRRKG